jgi:hypothetical protein
VEEIDLDLDDNGEAQFVEKEAPECLHGRPCEYLDRQDDPYPKMECRYVSEGVFSLMKDPGECPLHYWWKMNDGREKEKDMHAESL